MIKEGVSKVKGIESLLKYWHMEQAPYMAFGDSLNDKEMIKKQQLELPWKTAILICLPMRILFVVQAIKTASL